MIKNSTVLGIEGLEIAKQRLSNHQETVDQQLNNRQATPNQTCMSYYYWLKNPKFGHPMK